MERSKLTKACIISHILVGSGSATRDVEINIVKLVAFKDFVVQVMG